MFNKIEKGPDYNLKKRSIRLILKFYLKSEYYTG